MIQKQEVMFIRLIILKVLLVLVATEKVRYDNYALYKIIPQSQDHLDFLNNLIETHEDLDFWNEPTRIGEYVNVVSPPEARENFEHSLKKRSIHSELMLENIQEAFDAQLFSRRKRETNRELYWTNYQTIDEIYSWFHYLVENHGDVVSLITAGQSYEGKNITGVKISRGSSRRVFFLEAGQVGADWLSPTILTYFIDQLVRGEDPEARAASVDFEWHIFPIVNPDGHQFSQDSVRLWVKNRRPTTSNNIGVDLTKNWNSQWAGKLKLQIILEQTNTSEGRRLLLLKYWSVPAFADSGGSFVASANDYIGMGPFSEPETRSVSRYVETLGGSLTAFLSFRAYGQRLVIPFAHNASPMYNYNEMITIGRRAMGSLAVRYNTQYIVGNSLQVLDGATGSSIDWVKHRFNPPIAATYYLRDNGTWGYTLPVAQILPSCEETFDSLLAIIRESKFINVI